MYNVAETLRNAREESGYTLEDIGCKLGVSRQAVSSWETGKSVPTLKHFAELSGIYNKDIELLMGK